MHPNSAQSISHTEWIIFERNISSKCCWKINVCPWGSKDFSHTHTKHIYMFIKHCSSTFVYWLKYMDAQAHEPSSMLLMFKFYQQCNKKKKRNNNWQSQRRWASQQNSRNALISQCRVSDNIAMCLYKCIILRITYGMAIARMITIRMFYFKLCIFFWFDVCGYLYVFSCTIHCNSFVNLLNNKQRAHTRRLVANNKQIRYEKFIARSQNS